MILSVSYVDVICQFVLHQEVLYFLEVIMNVKYVGINFYLMLSNKEE